MASYRLAEIAVNLIEAQIKSKISTALSDVRTQRADPIVTTEIPQEYFIYEEAEALRTPSVFTIIQSQDFRNEVKGANHINASNTVLVAVVIEDRVKRLATIKAWRYQSALVQCLHLVSLTSTDSAVRLFVRVRECNFSGILPMNDVSTNDTVFRKEVSLMLDVDHIENLE
jgi:hypothetical protein